MVGFAFATVCVVVATEVFKFPSPLYVAVIGSLPSGSDEFIRVATPPTKVDVPNVVEPLVNVTVPVALLGNVSVSVTGLPGSDGFGEETRVDAGVALFTV
jgi:hypothetical protein